MSDTPSLRKPLRDISRQPYEIPTARDRSQITAKPLTETMPAKPAKKGRPFNLVMPDLPKMEMSTVEQGLFDYFMAAYNTEYPDLTPTDHLILHLAGLTYIKYLRVIAEELATGKVISMARQHPGIELRGLLDQLSVTRKARTRNKPATSEEEAELREFFMSMSSSAKGRQA
jgi:hypothetical protein